MWHAKLIVVHNIVFVGSSNLDPRSLCINCEIMLLIRDATLAVTARQQFEADLAQFSILIILVGPQHGLLILGRRSTALQVSRIQPSRTRAIPRILTEFPKRLA